jgi:transcriptional regulator with XRE-family HTH domain
VDNDYARRFGARLRNARTKREMSQEALAAKAGLHPTHISLIEGGKRTIKLDTLAKLARALRIQPSRLMPDISLK